MRFWDTSAVVPLILGESPADPTCAAEHGSGMCVWWGTTVEIASAIARRERAGALSGREAAQCLSRQAELASSWLEVPPSDALRAVAQRILRVHPLRAADSLQLAAALAAADGRVQALPFVCNDLRLAEAAAREGFRVIGP